MTPATTVVQPPRFGALPYPLAAWVLFIGALLLRQPGVLLHAEFWAEDGWVWFPDAYNHGVATVAMPVAGYLQTVSRLVALVAQGLPMAWAPTVFAAVALAIQAAAPAFLLSARMAEAWPSALGRAGFAAMWVALPNTAEVYANLTNAQWHLAVLAFLVLVSRPSKAWVFDAAVLALSGLSGPFCLLLLPIAAWRTLQRRDRASAWRLALLGATAAIQAAVLWDSSGARTAAPLGAGFGLLLQIIGQQVLLAPFIGQAHMERLRSLAVWRSGVGPFVVVAGAARLSGWALWRGPAVLRLACVLGATVLAASLLRPQVGSSGEQWAAMTIPGVGQRYYLIPMLAWLGVVAWAAARLLHGGAVTGLALALLLGVGVWSDWIMPPRVPTHYPALVKAFLKLPPGAAMTFPINPAFAQMPMILGRR